MQCGTAIEGALELYSGAIGAQNVGIWSVESSFHDNHYSNDDDPHAEQC